MAQLESVQTFADSGPNAAVDAARLNSHVNDAELLNGAVLDQPEKSVLVAGDFVLVGDSAVSSSGAVKKAQVQNLLTQTMRDGTQRWGGTAGGSANALTIATSPASTGAYANGEVVRFITGAAANSGATTINVDARGIKNLVTGPPIVAAMSGGELPAGSIVEAVFDGTQFQAVGVEPVKGISSLFLAEKARGACQQYDNAGGGSANAQTVNPKDSSGAVTYTALQDGMVIRFKAGFTNTGALTLAANGLTAKSVIDQDGLALAAGAVKAGQWHEVMYDAGQDKYILFGRGAAYQYIGATTALAATSVPGVNAKIFTDTHGLGAVPTRVHAVLVCTTADLGYSVGDQVDFIGISAGRPTLNVNATTVFILQTSTTIQIGTNTGTLGTGTSITLGSWSVKVYLGL